MAADRLDLWPAEPGNLHIGTPIRFLRGEHVPADDLMAAFEAALEVTRGK